MNILQVLPRLDEGGAETGTVDLVRYLLLHGHKAVVVSGGGKLVRKLHEVGARHYLIPVGSKFPFTFFSIIPKIVEVIRKENIQVVHARSRVPALACYIASRIAHIPLVTTAHGYYRKHLISRVMGWGKYVVVASNAMAYHMVHTFHTPREKIRLIPRGVDLDRFPYRHPHERDQKQFTIGMISRITPIKGHEYFIRAVAHVARKIPNLKVVIIGGVTRGKEKYKEELELLVRRLGLGETVSFLGPRDDVPELLAQMNMLVHSPLKQEAFGRAIIEAQAAGVPVIATSVAGIVDIVKDGQTGLLCSAEDPKDLAEKIVRLAKDRALQAAFADAGRRSVEEHFTLEKMASRTLQLYEDVLRMKRILVIKFSALGDVVLSVPSLRAIRNKFKDATIKVLVGMKAKDVLKSCPYINEIIVYDYKGRDRGIGGFIKYCALLRRTHYDISIDLQNNRMSHVLAFAALIPVRIGYENKKWSFLLNRRVETPREHLDPLSHQARLLSRLNIAMDDRSLELWPSESDEQWAGEFLERAWVRPEQLLIGINPGASLRWTTKRWPVKHFAKLCDMLANRLGARVLITGTKDDTEVGREIQRLCKSKPIMAIGKSSILQLTALIKRCSVFVTSDSAPMHIAAASNVGFIVLFGPTDPGRHAPPVQNRIIIRKKLSCSPCYRPRCHKDMACMNRITVDEVFEAVEQLLDAKNKQQTIDQKQ